VSEQPILQRIIDKETGKVLYEQTETTPHIRGDRAPFILLPLEDGTATLIDTAAIRSASPHLTGATVGLHPSGPYTGGVVFTTLSFDNLLRLLSEHGIVIIDATGVRDG